MDEFLGELTPLVDLDDSTSTSPIYVRSSVGGDASNAGDDGGVANEMVTWRRWFHAHPEKSFEEYETSRMVASSLRDMGIEEVYVNIGRTGVVGVIRGGMGGGGEGPCVALRADMDALTITEMSDVEYKSKNIGMMHACGHDGHMASLLGAARIINDGRRLLRGCVKLIFQPAEEGYNGASAMIDDGVLEDGKCGPRVDVIYGIHLWSLNPLGTIAATEGPILAASDKFVIDVRGKGGHGAAPHTTVDAIVEAAAVIQGLQTIVSRNLDPLETGVVTCGTVGGGYGYNIIADHVEITGTCRTFKPAIQEMIKTRMRCMCEGISRSYGGDIDVKYEYGYPPTVNSYPEHCKRVVDVGTELVGLERASVQCVTMGAEDFSYYLHHRPGCFFFVGAALPGEIRGHHKSVFDFDERALQVSASMFVGLVAKILA
jgi:amidohydrolase